MNIRSMTGYGRSEALTEEYRLVVEIKSENSEAQWLRNACAAERTPYLRFYYNHDGWWNTREYVDTRVRQALGL